jgi:hypothetical protein
VKYTPLPSSISSISYHHCHHHGHHHRYHHRKGNTATRSPYYLIAITHRALVACARHPCNRTSTTHNIHLTFSLLLRHGSIRVLSISSSLRCHICSRHPGFISISCLLLPPPPPPPNEPPPSTSPTPCSIGVPIVSYPTHGRVGDVLPPLVRSRCIHIQSLTDAHCLRIPPLP